MVRLNVRERYVPVLEEYFGITANHSCLCEIYTRVKFPLTPCFSSIRDEMVFATDHPNYARWLSVHLFDLLQLKYNFPQLYDNFNNGQFTFQKSQSTPIWLLTRFTSRIMRTLRLLD